MLVRGMAARLSPGTLVAGYRIESVLGRGAMGEVYRALDASGRVVALKILDDALERDERFRQRFFQESTVAARLDDPHVVQTLDAGEDGGRLYLALELIEGSDLRRLLDSEGRLEPGRAVDIVAQVAGGLDAAHTVGLVHRDVKPGNILIGADGHAYICDFGLARHVSSVSSLTGDRGFVGTIDYVPPEQIEGARVDARDDVYSLGCVLYECLTGVRPFQGESELSVVFAHLNEPPPRVTDVHDTLPAAFDDVVATALAKSPGDRYATCGELATAAHAALQGRVLARRKPRRRAMLSGAAALVVALGAIGGYTLARAPHPRRVTITPMSVVGARLGDSSIALDRIWGTPEKTASLQTPADYTELSNGARDVSAYFVGTADKAVEIATWNSADKTALGVGPCSTLTALRSAYGPQLKAAPKHGGYTVGKHLFFAIASGGAKVSAVALYTNPLEWASFNALNEPPCSAGSTAALGARPAAQAASSAPRGMLASQRFAPRLSVRTPGGWRIRSDTPQQLTLASTAGTTIDFRLDPVATSHGKPLVGVSGKPNGLATWLGRDRSLVTAAPRTMLIGKPALTATAIDLRLAGRARSVDVLRFTDAAPLHLSGSERVRLYLTEVRIGTLTHTLAISVAPSNVDSAPVAAIVSSIEVAATPVQPLSAVSTQCSKPFGGTCLGELAAGTYRTTTFEPGLTYTVPVDWTNYQDLRGDVAFVPPGGDWNAVDSDSSDYLGVFTRLAAAPGPCANGPSAIRTPAAFARWLARNPGLTVSGPKQVTVGGLSGYVADLRMRPGWKTTCPFSNHQPYVQILTGLPPTVTQLEDGVVPRPMVMRLYLLGYRGGTLGIDIHEVAGSSKLGAYSAVVRTFRFGTG